MNSWASPPTRTEIIENLVSGVDRYNPSNVGILEDYLYHQIRSQEYDCLANLAILKLYQFNPDLYNPDVVVNILLKALVHPETADFTLCLALLDDRPQTSHLDEPDPMPTILPQLNDLHASISGCRFPAFWAAYGSDELQGLRENYTVEVAGFEDSVRAVAARAIAATFTRIALARLGSYLNLEGSELEAYVSKLEWSVDAASGMVAIPPNPDTQIESTVVQENIKLNQLVKIISHSANSM